MPQSYSKQCLADPTINPELCMRNFKNMLQNIDDMKPRIDNNPYMRALSKSPYYDETQDDSSDDESVDDIMRRLAISNSIKGTNVNTNQDIKEVNYGKLSAPNEDEIDIITRKLAISNEISGENVNTNQEVNEYNMGRRAEEIRKQAAHQKYNIKEKSKPQEDDAIKLLTLALQKLLGDKKEVKNDERVDSQSDGSPSSELNSEEILQLSGNLEITLKVIFIIKILT
jgi:hypothetical protein